MIYLDIHQVLLLVTIITFGIYSLYAGVVYPILDYKFKFKGYSHESNIWTRSLSILMCTSILIFLILKTLECKGDLKCTSLKIWQICDYWRDLKDYQIPVELFWYIYVSLFFIASMNITFAFMARFPKESKTIQQSSERHGFVIVAHNSSEKLGECIEKILKFADPHQIFIADNGSTIVEQNKTDRICKNFSRMSLKPIPKFNLKELSKLETSTSNELLNELPNELPNDLPNELLNDLPNELPNELENELPNELANELPKSRINVVHLEKGNKTLAQYSTIVALNEWLQMGESKIDLITILDDDVYIPETFPSNDIEEIFNDETKIAAAYPLNVYNNKDNLCGVLQEIEYYSGNVARYVQDICGSQLFCSGAIATWRSKQLLKVLEEHCTTFNGEDLEMGYLTHALNEEELDTSGNKRIGFINCTIETSVPHHYFHWFDCLPNPLKRKIAKNGCECGEHSLFNQRLRSWDPANYQFFFKYAKILFSKNGKSYKPKMFIRLVCLWKILGILREITLLVGMIIPIVKLRNSEMTKILFVFYFDSILIAWCFAFIWTWFISTFSLSRIDNRLRPDTMLFYPILFEIPYLLIIKPLSMMYTFTYYIYWRRFPQPIKEQIKDNVEFRDSLHNAWK
jgi:hypothetical protein